MFAYHAAYAASSVETDPSDRPHQFFLKTSKIHTIGMFLLMLPGIAIACAVPVVVAALATRANTSLLALAAERPLVTAQLAFATFLACALIYPALKTLFWRLGRRVTISFDENNVTVRERHLIGSKTWSEPVRNYRGLVCQTVATAGGFRQHLVMLHPRADRSILLHIAPQISTALIESCCDRFDLPELNGVSASAYSTGASLRGRLASLRACAPENLDPPAETGTKSHHNRTDLRDAA